MAFRMALLVDHVPQSLNRKLRAHWATKQRENREWDAIIGAMVYGRRPPAPLERAKISIVRHSYRSLDFDGLVGSLKPVVDALVTARVLRDDSWRVLGAWDVDQCFRAKSSGPLLEILIEEIPDTGLN